ncbi:polysaccharide deacetylase family protein [Anaerotignum sp.]
MGKRKTAVAVLALVFSLFSLSAAYAAEEESAAEPQYVKYAAEATDPEELYGEYIPVLMYHHFAIRDMGSGNGVVTTVTELEDQLRYFKAEGYKIISLEQLDKILKKTEKNTRAKGIGLGLDQKYLCITMDDGYYSNYDLGYPLFEKYRIPVSIFAVTDYVTNQIGIQKFTWKQAWEMENSGWVKIYSHTADHQPVEAGKEEEFLASVQRSEEALDENLTADHVKAISYPNGRYTEESQRLLEEDGYVLQFTVENSVITRATSRDALPRIMVSSGMDGKDVVRKIELAAERAFAAEREGI